MGFLGEQPSGKGGDDQMQMGCWWERSHDGMESTDTVFCACLVSFYAPYPHLIPTYQRKCNFSASLSVS